MILRLALITWLLLACPAAHAATIHTNGLGGGAWQDAATWRGGVLPTAEDDVVIRKHDRVTFSGTRQDPACRQLLLDPDAVLLLKPDKAGDQVVFHLTGPIDCYGSIQANLTNHLDASVTLRLSDQQGDTPAVTLRQRGQMLLYGAVDPLDEKPNVILEHTGGRQGVARIHAGKGSRIDLRWTQLGHIALLASQIDNSGSSPHQGVNVQNNRFLGRSTLQVVQCDTANIAGNVFQGDVQGVTRAIEVRASPLASITDNRISGTYSTGLHLLVSNDVRLAGNAVRGVRAGVVLYHCSGVIERLHLEDCDQGVIIEQRSEVTVENSVIRAGRSPMRINGSDVQLSSVRIEGAADRQPLLTMEGGSLSMVNCAIKPGDIRMTPSAATAAAAGPPVRAFAYVVVKVAGAVDRRMQVDLLPESPAGGQAHLDVRNTPALLRLDGLTPLPQSRRAIQALAWSMAADGRVSPAPEYRLRVITPAGSDGQAPHVHAQQVVTPQESWFRPLPDALTPTLEVALP